MAFSLVTNSLNRHLNARPGSSSRRGQGKKNVDPLEDPETAERLRAKFPDFDLHCDIVNSVDHVFECKSDPKFAQRYAVPSAVKPHFKVREHRKGIDAVRLTTWGYITAGHDCVKAWKNDKVVRDSPFSAYDCVVAPRDEFAVLVGPSGYEVVDVASLECRKKVGINAECIVQTCAIQTALSNKCATGDQFGTLRVHDLESGKQSFEWTPHVTSISCIRWRDSNTVLCGSRDGKITIWDVRQDPGGTFRYLASSILNTVSSKSCFEIIPHESHAVFDMDLKGDVLFTCGGDNSLKQFDLRFDLWEHEEKRKYLGHILPIRSLALSPDREMVATCCEDGSARVFAVDELAYRKCEARHSAEGKLKLREFTRTGISTALVCLVGHTGIVTGATWTGNTALMTCSWDQSVQKYDLSRHITYNGGG